MCIVSSFELYYYSKDIQELDVQMNNNTASRAKEMRIVESFVDCNDILGDHVNLQSRATENGYLYFPGLLPAEEVFSVRHEVLQVA